MNLEIESITKNDTWELVSLPADTRVIGVKWVYKTKYNEKEEIDMHRQGRLPRGMLKSMGYIILKFLHL